MNGICTGMVTVTTFLDIFERSSGCRSTVDVVSKMMAAPQAQRQSSLSLVDGFVLFRCVVSLFIIFIITCGSVIARLFFTLPVS